MQATQNPKNSLPSPPKAPKLPSVQVKLKNELLLYLWSICIAMGSLVMGYLFVIITGLNSSITWSMSQQHPVQKPSQTNSSVLISICTGILPLGAFLSSLMYSRIIQKIKSQNYLMILCDISMIIVVIFQMLSLNIYLLITTRFFQGMIIGVSCIIVPTYLMSISPRKISGRIGSLNQLFITIGIALGYAMGFRINEQDLGNFYNWRLCVFIPILMCLVRIIACIFFPLDTIQRHISNKNWKILSDYIHHFYQPSTFSLQDLINNKNINISSTTTQQPKQSSSQKQSRYQQNLQNIQTPSEKCQKSQSHQSQSSLKIRKYLSITLCILNQFCGINAILFYSNQLFENLSNGNKSVAVQKSLQLGIFQVVVTLISGYFMDNFGRRILMLGGLSFIILSLFGGYLMLQLNTGSYVIYLIFMHIGSFSLSLGPITVVYISQIIQDISPYMTVVWIQTIFIALTSNIMIEHFGIGKVFLFYALICLVGLFYIFRFMIQSKGKSKMEIIQKYQQINSKRTITTNGANKHCNNDTVALENIQYLEVKTNQLMQQRQ